MASTEIFITLLAAAISIQPAYAQTMEGMNGMGGEPANIEPMPETEKEWVRQSMAFADILGMLDVFMGQTESMKSVEMEDAFWDLDWMD
ncbi:hypothetical protein COS16_01450, partial [Candidatus Desantisbacteria bacterium CG02_land_8_20_14_3_00_49_13]